MNRNSRAPTGSDFFTFLTIKTEKYWLANCEFLRCLPKWIRTQQGGLCSVKSSCSSSR